jgi:hypothetical protein
MPGAGQGVSHEDAVRRLERLADRLRVVGPRLSARQDPAAEELLAIIRDRLQQLADLAADIDGEPRRMVPELAGHALADQALVLGYDLLGGPLDPGAEAESDSGKNVAPSRPTVSDESSEPEGAGAANAPLEPLVTDAPSELIRTSRSSARSEQDRVNAMSIVAQIRDLI